MIRQVVPATRLTMILAGLAWELTHPPAPADPSSISIHIDQGSALERSYRLSGSIRNAGDVPVSELTAMITLADCSTEPCTVVAEAPMSLLIHIPAGGEYPLAHVVEIPRQDVTEPRWSAQVTAARVSEAR